MRKKMLILVSFVLMLAMFSNVFAADRVWRNYAPGDNLWSTLGNWQDDLIPGISDGAVQWGNQSSAADGPLIDSTMDINIARCMGPSWGSTSRGYLTQTGGTLNVSDFMRLGNGGTAISAQWTMSGGTADINTLHVGYTNGCVSWIDLSNNAILNVGGIGFWIDGSSIDITDNATLTIDGNVTGHMAPGTGVWYLEERITADGDVDLVDCHYDSPTNTTIFTVPGPADRVWRNYAPEDNLWSTPGNWQDDNMPGILDGAVQWGNQSSPADGPLINSTMNISIARCMGPSWGSTNRGYLTQTGGTLNVSDFMRLGNGGDAISAQWTMSGGTADIDTLHVGYTNGCVSWIDMSNDAILNVGGIGFWIDGSHIDITGNATLSIHGNVAGHMTPGTGEWYLDERITSYGDVDLVDCYYDSSTGTTVFITIGMANNPSPCIGATGVSTDVVLSWLSEVSGAYHDVYFGTSLDDVLNANTSTPDIYRGRQAADARSYTPETLEEVTTYYWRIDEIDDPNIWKGRVWHFSTGAPGLVGYWKLDEQSGSTTILDWSGEDSDGTVKDVYGVDTVGLNGDYATFTGDGYVGILGAKPSDPRYDTTTDFTWALRINALEGVESFMMGRANAGTGSWSDGERMFALRNGGRLTYWAHGSDYIQGNQSLRGQWCHVAVTYDDTAKEVTLYVDGLLEKQETRDYSGLNEEEADIRLGFISDVGWYYGDMEEVKVYDRALSEEEMRQLTGIEAYAWNPDPADDAVNVPIDAILSWSPGDTALSHDVYFGVQLVGDIDGDGHVGLLDMEVLAEQWLTDPCGSQPSADLDGDNFVDLDDFAVVSGDWMNDLLVFMGNQDPCSYDPCGFESCTTYYWRIDEVDDDSCVWKGDIWSFNTNWISAQEGWNIYDPPSSPGYRYGPSIIINDDGSIDMWCSSPGSGTEWDWIRHKNSTDGGHTWGTETTALRPTPGSLDAYSTCDPGVIKFGGYYYIGYTSTSNPQGKENDVFVARSTSPYGGGDYPNSFEKWNGTGWGGEPQPFIEFTGTSTHYGAGEPSFVVKDGTLFIYYTWSDGTNTMRVATADASNENWPGDITHHGEILAASGVDVKYIDAMEKFIAIRVASGWNASSYISMRASTDGITFATVDEVRDNLQLCAHNPGISGTAEGHIDLNDDNFVAYAYEEDCLDNWAYWPTWLNPITFDFE